MEMIPLFYKSHYEVIAAKIHEEYTKGNAETKQAIGTLAIKLAVVFEHDNARFNREKFLLACGVTERRVDEDAS